MEEIKRDLAPARVCTTFWYWIDHTYKQIWSGKIPADKKEGRWIIPSEVIAERMRQRTTKAA